MFSLDETTVVTGEEREIRRRISRAMARAGADVVITGRSAEPLEEAAEKLRGWATR